MRRPRVQLVLLLLLASTCGPPHGVPIATSRLPLPDGQMAVAIRLPVPPRSAHGGDEYMLRLRLVARCDPSLRVRFPDGEEATLAPHGWGVDESAWQRLEAERAQAGEPATATAVSSSVAPTSTSAASATETPPISSAASSAAPLDAPAPPAPVAGHYRAEVSYSWPDQASFLSERRRRCATSRTVELTHRLAYVESDVVTVWPAVPQEIAGATLTLEVDDLPGTAPPPPASAATTVAPPSPPPPAPELASSPDDGEPPKPLPPMPPPKDEPHDPTKVAAGAKWHPGYWGFSEGSGRWVWVAGWWDAPDQTPPPKAEAAGTPPIAGCLWHDGHWEWVSDGHWEWHPGYWDPPPLRPESPGTPPGDGSQWSHGFWQATDGTFLWIAGSWSKPVARVETPPPPPHENAHWIAGVWIQVGASWIWSPGFYAADGMPPPPPPRAEQPPPAPAPGAVWIEGYWQWDDTGRAYAWTAGHWESPPSVGYVWVADPPPVGYTIVPRGHWVLRVDVDATPPLRERTGGVR